MSGPASDFEETSMTQRPAITRRHLLAGFAAVGSVLAGGQAAAQVYPSRLIKVLVGVPPGGSTDNLTRQFAEWLRQSMGQPTIVENRTGVNSALAADAVARSAPDGYTLLAATDAFITVPLLQRVNFDPYRSF